MAAAVVVVVVAAAADAPKAVPRADALMAAVHRVGVRSVISPAHAVEAVAAETALTRGSDRAASASRYTIGRMFDMAGRNEPSREESISGTGS